jgi:predicted DNA repair protein MutK
MAGASLLALLDDIATVLDDVSIMTKVAAKKTAGVLGDDLALNAEQVNGVRAERELPVVWAVALGSMKNKVILVPAALLISALLPQAIIPLLMIGGLYLCFEGVEKLAHKFLPHDDSADAAEHDAHLAALSSDDIDLVALEKDKIKGAIRTDFVLSAEIIVIALGTVADKSLGTQFMVLAGIGVIMTVGVYGLVAGIVKMDDAGFYLLKKTNSALNFIGRGLVAAAPKLMKVLTVVGTAAMFLVGGGILTHGISALHHAIENISSQSGTVMAVVIPNVANLIVGIVAGSLALAVFTLGSRIFGKKH